MTKIEGQLSTSTMCLQSAQSPLSMKIARFGQDTDIARMAVPHRMAARRLRVPDLVGRAGFGIEAPFAAQRIEHRRPVDDVRRPQVDHPFLASLHPTRGEHQPRRHYGRQEERRVGKEWVSTLSARWPPDHSKKKTDTYRSHHP